MARRPGKDKHASPVVVTRRVATLGAIRDPNPPIPTVKTKTKRKSVKNKVAQCTTVKTRPLKNGSRSISI